MARTIRHQARRTGGAGFIPFERRGVSREWSVVSGHGGSGESKELDSVPTASPFHSPFIAHHSPLKLWGISATIGNLEEAAEVLLGNDFPPGMIKMVRANLDKKLLIKSIIPENIEEVTSRGRGTLA